MIHRSFLKRSISNNFDGSENDLIISVELRAILYQYLKATFIWKAVMMRKTIMKTVKKLNTKWWVYGDTRGRRIVYNVEVYLKNKLV